MSPSEMVLATAIPRALTAPEFRELTRVAPTTEWFANIDNANTRCDFSIMLSAIFP
jgi:hypothetical protein